MNGNKNNINVGSIKPQAVHNIISKLFNEVQTTNSSSTDEAQDMVNSLLGIISTLNPQPSTTSGDVNVEATAPMTSEEVIVGPEDVTMVNTPISTPLDTSSDTTVDNKMKMKGRYSSTSSDDSDTSLVQSQEFLDTIVAEQLMTSQSPSISETSTMSRQGTFADMLGFLNNR
jgi:hypothetical protein